MTFITKPSTIESEGEFGVVQGTTAESRSVPDLDVLEEVQQRVLWLATRIIDAANRRESDIKVGGHQASSASVVSMMTALWFAHLNTADKVAVKPHASPAYHAIKYLTGELDRSYLTRLRQRGGLQAYPSRTKDPDVSDFSTGSVGLGAVAPLFSAVTRRYVDSHFGKAERSRFVALVGDAELDEGNVWEAVADPVTAGLGEVTLLIDLNRQSLDRVIPGIQASRLSGFFANVGWHVTEVKYGRRLEAAFRSPGGEALRAHIDAMSNEAYQHLFTLRSESLRDRFLAGADPAVVDLVSEFDDAQLFATVTDLGGHDLGMLIEALRECDQVTDRPSVMFAYTIKGWGLPIAGDALNHSALLTEEQINRLREQTGLKKETEWDRFEPDSPAGRLCAEVGSRINNAPTPPRPTLSIPAASSTTTTSGKLSSQDAFGRSLTRLADVPGVGERIVTVAPDVSVTTNLGGWINKAGVYSHQAQADHGGGDRLVKWAPSPSGQHIELGISEMNLFMLLGQLGLSHDHHGEHLLPIGAVYDPFILRGLDAFIYGAYNDSRFIVAGTPSGVTLAPEGGAHQSTITASAGAELPNVCYVEPCFATEVDWMLCDALGRLAPEDGESTYMRLSTRPIDQAPFAAAITHYGENRLRELVIAGGYRLAEPEEPNGIGVTIVTTGAMVPEALAAQGELRAEGVDATVVHLTSPDRAFRSWQGRHRRGAQQGTVVRQPSHIHQLIPPSERHRPIVSVHDAASHSLSWLGSAVGVTQVALGVDQFGESGTIADLHDIAGISTGNIVNAGLIAVFEDSSYQSVRPTEPNS